MFLEALLCSVGNLSSFTGLAREFHFFRIQAVCFNEFFAIMAEKNNRSSVRIKGDFFFSIGRDIHKITFDTIESSIFSFWSRCGGLNWFRHRGNCREEKIFDELKVIDKIYLILIIFTITYANYNRYSRTYSF